MSEITYWIGTAARAGTASSNPENLHFTYGNTGNLLIVDAVRCIPGVKVVAALEDLKDAQSIVLPLANFIHPHVAGRLTPILEAVESSTAERVVCLSGGAQAYSYDDDIPFIPEVRRLLDIFRERSKSIGVRGAYTANLLERNGYKDVEITGCPSVHEMVRRGLRPRRDPPANPRIALHFTLTGDYRHEIAALWKFGAERDALYVLQNETNLAAMLEDPKKEPEEIPYYADIPPADLKAWMLRRARIWFDVDRWIQDLAAECDVVAGMRFHGNVAAMMAGLPALTLAWDTRTQELCEHHGMPFKPMRGMQAEDVLREVCRSDLDTQFHQVAARRLADYDAFLARNGLVPGPRS